jgi:hypothetical protein
MSRHYGLLDKTLFHGVVRTDLMTRELPPETYFSRWLPNIPGGPRHQPGRFRFLSSAVGQALDLVKSFFLVVPA